VCCCVFVWYGWCVMCKTQTSSESSSDDEGLLDDSIWLLAAGVVDVVVVVVAFVAIEVVLLDLLLVDKLLLLFSLFFFFWTRDDDLEHLSDCRLGFSALSEESASDTFIVSFCSVRVDRSKSWKKWHFSRLMSSGTCSSSSDRLSRRSRRGMSGTGGSMRSGWGSPRCRCGNRSAGLNRRGADGCVPSCCNKSFSESSIDANWSFGSELRVVWCDLLKLTKN